VPAPLEKVARAPVLAPIAGIFLNLDEAFARATAAADQADAVAAGAYTRQLLSST
jgi:hypothetical protein